MKRRKNLLLDAVMVLPKNYPGFIDTYTSTYCSCNTLVVIVLAEEKKNFKIVKIDQNGQKCSKIDSKISFFMDTTKNLLLGQVSELQKNYFVGMYIKMCFKLSVNGLT